MACLFLFFGFLNEHHDSFLEWSLPVVSTCTVDNNPVKRRDDWNSGWMMIRVSLHSKMYQNVCFREGGWGGSWNVHKYFLGVAISIFYLECRKTSLCFRSSKKKTNPVGLNLNNLPLWSVSNLLPNQITKTAAEGVPPPLFQAAIWRHFRCWKLVHTDRWLNKLWKWCQGPISMLSICCNDIQLAEVA